MTFEEWVIKWNIGPSMNDAWRTDNRRRYDPSAVPITQYSGGDGTVGDGWVPILDRLTEDLVAMGWDRSLDQVKEKFGGLRFYVKSYPETDGFVSRIHQAEMEAAVTCEDCGASGSQNGPTTPNGYWLKTLCDGCRGFVMTKQDRV